MCKCKHKANQPEKKILKILWQISPEIYHVILEKNIFSSVECFFNSLFSNQLLLPVSKFRHQMSITDHRRQGRLQISLLIMSKIINSKWSGPK